MEAFVERKQLYAVLGIVSTLALIGAALAVLRLQPSSPTLVGPKGPGETDSAGLPTCVYAYEAALDADDVPGDATPSAAILADPITAREIGLVETVVDDAYSMFKNASATYDVRRYGINWVVTAGLKEAGCDLDPFTGELVDTSE